MTTHLDYLINAEKSQRLNLMSAATLENYKIKSKQLEFEKQYTTIWNAIVSINGSPMEKIKSPIYFIEESVKVKLINDFIDLGYTLTFTDTGGDYLFILCSVTQKKTLN